MCGTAFWAERGLTKINHPGIGPWVLRTMRTTKTTTVCAAARWAPDVLARVWPRLHRMKLGLIVLTALVFALTTLITLGVKHSGENGIKTENHLQSCISQMQVQDGLEWRVISGRIQVQAVRQAIAASRVRAGKHLAGAVSNGLSPSTITDITAVTRRYEQGVDEEMGMLEQGSILEALRLDQTRVDPMFGQVTRLLDVQTSRLASQAQEAQRLSDAGILLTVLLSLLLVSVVQSRRRRLEVRNQAVRASEVRYRTLIDQSRDLVLVVDRAGQVSFASPSAERLLASDDQGLRLGTTGDTDMGPIDFVGAVEPPDRSRLSAALHMAGGASRSIGEFRLTPGAGSATFELTMQDVTEDRRWMGSY